MRLIELEPKWFTAHASCKDVRVLIGLTFLCPHCKVQRIAINFTPAIDPDNILPRTTWKENPDHWKRTGDTFDTLTLGPSIDVSKYCHWHGHIIDGEVIT